LAFSVLVRDGARPGLRIPFTPLSRRRAMSDPTSSEESAALLRAIAGRAAALYSRPSVAMELVRLTEQPQVDPLALRECLETDPALASKILRVVNSSLFGLTTRVADLGQAIALLGIKPLKLLVLGFSLPDTLFADVAVRELRWYWTTTLTRAAAARMLSEQLWRQPGDEAFIAGLLEDLGTLVMLREVGLPYARFLRGAIDERCQLSALEYRTLGFDHVQLTAALLARWQLPKKLTDAIVAPREMVWLTQLPPADAELPQILHLADLLTQLLCQRRLGVLSELVEAVEVYRGVTKDELTEFVMQLQPQVDQLADAMALELEGDRDYAKILCEAHARMGVLSEEIVAQLRERRSDTDSYERLRRETGELTDAVRAVLTATGGKSGADRSNNPPPPSPAINERTFSTSPSLLGVFQSNDVLTRKLRIAVERCRKNRQELSLLLVDARAAARSAGDTAEQIGRSMRRVLSQACATLDPEHVEIISVGEWLSAVVLSNCERNIAVTAANYAIRHGSKGAMAPAGCATATDVVMSIGVATASAVPRNFDPVHLVESAERCLNAARASGASTVKSIEV
jgi:HD-like signal output (HDOD) protein